jgi:hypothetical protein
VLECATGVWNKDVAARLEGEADPYRGGGSAAYDGWPSSTAGGHTRTVGVRITAGDTELVSLHQTVQAGVQQSVIVTVPRVQQTCATLQADGESATLRTP